MNLDRIAQELDLTYLTPELKIEYQSHVSYGYASDLLSDVLGHAVPGGLLVTTQVHVNVIVVAVRVGLSGIVLTSSRTPDESMRRRAIRENVPLFSSRQTTFDIAGRLYLLGLRGLEQRLG